MLAKYWRRGIDNIKKRNENCTKYDTHKEIKGRNRYVTVMIHRLSFDKN